MQKTIAALCVAVLTIVAYKIVTRTSVHDEFSVQVEEIVSVGQTYDGEHVDRLIALGPFAAPAIGEKMLAVEEFQLTYIQALSGIGSSEGVEPLLQFLDRILTENHTLAHLTIDALREIGDSRPTERLRQIYADDSIHPSVRLAAAGCVARISEGDIKAESIDHIFEMYDARSNYYGKRGAGFEEIDMIDALTGAANDAANQILIDLLESVVDPYEADPIIRYFSNRPEFAITNSLMRVVDRTVVYEPHIQVMALDALLKADRGLTEAQKHEVWQQIQTRAEQEDWSPRNMDRVKDIGKDLEAATAKRQATSTNTQL